MTREQPRLERQTRRIVLMFGAIGITVSVLAFVLYWWLRGSWLEALLGAIAVGMSLLPEEFPLVLTVFMVMGAWRLSQSRVLTRRAAAIEALGAATVLCTDKTGTLTRNLMSVAYLQANGGRAPTDVWEPELAATEDSRLCIAVRTADSRDAGQRRSPAGSHGSFAREPQRPHSSGHARGDLDQEYPLQPTRLAVTRYGGSGFESLTVATKGAPEAVAALCGFTPAELAALRARVDELARQGMRVLAAARATTNDGLLPESPDFPFRFLGLIGFADPLRESVPDAIRECRSAGIRVVMITGDYPATAKAIARQAGIEEGEVCSGEELRSLDDDAFALRVRTTSVFARISPEQKLRIVNALKANGEVVAMTGDGVNDAPALKAAHIGIAMGGRGTDVAREASSIVLLDDDFGSIVHAVRLGRRIYDNMRKAMGYILAIHVPLAGLALLPILLGWPLVLTPHADRAAGADHRPRVLGGAGGRREESDIMARPPRPRACLCSVAR